MIDERHEELAALYALDLLEGAEKAAFETDLAASEELRALVRELRDASGQLAYTAPQMSPPPALKARLLDELDRRTAPAEVAADRLVPFVLPAWVPWTAAAAFAVIAGWLGQIYLAERAENLRLRDEASVASFELRTARNQLEASALLARRELSDAKQDLAARDEKIAALNQRVDALAGATADIGRQLGEAKELVTALRQRLKDEHDIAQLKIATLASLAGNTPQAQAVAVWDPLKQEGVLQVEKLPALAADKDYQLWVIDPQYPNPVDGGVFQVDPATGEARVAFHPDKPVRTAAKFAVSLERKGGVPKAEGPILLLGE
jgi:anti-sigma-K factor RskA